MVDEACPFVFSKGVATENFFFILKTRSFMIVLGIVQNSINSEHSSLFIIIHYFVYYFLMFRISLSLSYAKHHVIQQNNDTYFEVILLYMMVFMQQK
jgi:hypothetical protein